MKKYIFGITIILTILILTTIQFTQLKNAKFEKTVLTQNIAVLNKNFFSYKTAFGHATAKVEALTYSKEEMTVYESNLLLEIGELQIKPKNVISAAEIGISSGLTIKTIIQYVDSTKCFNYSDKYNKINGCFRGDSIGINIISFDSLTTVVSKIPKHKFLWWTWGIKAIQLDIMSQNPNTTINYLKYIELK